MIPQLCADESRGVAFGKFCLWEDVSDKFSQIIKHLLIPPVEVLDFAPLGGSLNYKVKL